MALATAIAEGVAKTVSDKGIAASVRPKRYFTLQKESVDGVFNELHELLNFFVLEFQRVLFVENVFVTFTVSNLHDLNSSRCH
jgi:hypothetical protein